MAGPWLLAASAAIHFILIKADGSLTSSLIPVATICPVSGGSSTGPTQDGDYSTTSATVTLPDGGSTIFATRVKRQSEQLNISTGAADAAHLVSGTDGCSTLFTPTTFSACSTIVRPIGLPAVTITECDQYVTFSSETLFMCAPTPTITPIPASSDPYNKLAGSFTSRPNLTQNDTFVNATTTYTGGVDSPGAELASTSTLPLAIKRQIMFDRNGEPIEMEAAIIAPGKHLNPRQLMFDRNSGKVITELVIVAPSITSALESIPTEMPMRNKITASGMTDTGNLTPPKQTTVNLGTPVTTKLIPIPDMLKAKYKRKYIAIGHKARHDEPKPIVAVNVNIDDNEKRDIILEGADSADVTTGDSMKITDIPDMTEMLPNTNHNPSLGLKDIRAAFHDSHRRARAKRLADAPTPIVDTSSVNSTKLSSKLAKLDIIRFANAAYAAREAQVPGVQNLSPPSPTKFYAAPWSEIIEGSIPKHILGITCYGGGEHIGKCTEPDSDGDPEECECVTERQSWSVSSFTETRIGTTIVSYSGPLMIIGAGGGVTSTDISFLSTMSTTRTFLDSFVVKSTLTGEETVTQTMTSVPSATISLMPVGGLKAAAPQDAPASLSDDEATTVYSTTYVATETVTVQPAEESGDMTGDGSGNDAVHDAGVDGNVNGKRDASDDCEKRSDGGWPCDAWTVKLKMSGSKAET